MKLPVILTTHGLTVSFADGPRMMRRDHASFEKALAAWRKEDYELLSDVMNPKKSLVKFSEGGLTFTTDNQVLFKDQPIHNYVLNKILELQAQSLPWRNLARFLERLMANPSARAVGELYKFLETENLPITDDGCFLAYKRVRDDWLDFHTGKIANKIGTTVEMPRNAVDDDASRGCSFGLHAGSLSYVSTFNSGGHLLIVKIDPADVISIPNEDVRKLRTCRYFVMCEMEGKLVDSAVYSGSTARPIVAALPELDFSDDDEDEEDEDFEDELEDDLEDEDFDDEGEVEEVKAVKPRDHAGLGVSAPADTTKTLQALSVLAKRAAGCIVAVDRPLSLMLTTKEFLKFSKSVLEEFHDDDFELDISEEDTLEEIAVVLDSNGE